MKDYSDYDMIAFASDLKFQNWVLDRTEGEYWKEVLSFYPDKAKEMERAKDLLLSIDFKIQKTKDEVIEEHLSNALRIIENKRPATVIHFKKWGWAAAVMVVFAAGYWLIRNTAIKKNQREAAAPLVIEDLVPGGERATLTLADGTRVILDSADNGQLATQGNVTVIKLDDGQLSYKGNGMHGAGSGQALYNTISTPAGGVYQLVLSDGTQVWLNAMSSLKFPAVFTGKERRVELKGEAYFEVMSNASRPFFVNAGEMDIKVLGTHFNVKAYRDDPIFQTTLLEGKVEVSSEKERVDITPGQQARMNVKVKNIKKMNGVNINDVMAWKNGEFFFEETELKDALRTLSRWYDFDVEYREDFEPTFIYGSISRNKNLSEVLKILEASGIHFRIERMKNMNRLVVVK
ncbi:MAG: FecR domain-containing protein [Chitinophagaceae bacterium]|nr:FecR domain-containing protein [Chitinophagaceae bacterium]